MAPSSARAAAATGEDTLIRELNENDVLLGRGKGVSETEGNIKFRALIATRKEEYNAWSSYNEKARIAREVFDEISSRGGRFVEQVTVAAKRKGKRRRKSAGESSVAWRQVPIKTSLEKCKQALREKLSEGNDKEADKTEIPERDDEEQTSIKKPFEEQALSEGSETRGMEEEEEEEVDFEEDEHHVDESSEESERSETPLSPRSDTPLSPLALEMKHHDDESSEESECSETPLSPRSETLSPLALEMMSNINASFDGTMPADPLTFDSDAHEESDRSHMEWSSSPSPVLPSKLIESTRPCTGDARLELFQTAPGFSFQQPMPAIPERYSSPSEGRQSPYMYDDFPPPATYSDIDTAGISAMQIPNQSGPTAVQASVPTNHHGVPESVLTTLGLGEDQPKFTDQDEQKELAALSDEEKASVLVDLFGKKCSLDTPQTKRPRRDFDESTVSFLLKQMRAEIEMMPEEKKGALIVAHGNCREEEFSDSRLEVFLRSEGMNAKLAAQRFVHYWQCRLELFGPDKFTLRMTLSEALCDDLVALKSGALCLLPSSDASERRIVFNDPSRHSRKGYTSDSLVRVLWYLAEIIVREPGYGGGGFVAVAWTKKSTIWNHDNNFCSKMSYYSHNAWPVKAMPTHVCCASKMVLRLVKPVFFALVDRTHRSRLVVHDVDDSEILHALSGYGLEKEVLPTEMGGSVQLNLEDWIADRRAIEMEEI